MQSPQDDAKTIAGMIQYAGTLEEVGQLGRCTDTKGINIANMGNTHLYCINNINIYIYIYRTPIW